ncbi:hypothetical protein LZ012_14175 [Dechloromonas sp. XY25]|uniref:Uncharacterized protein n=1 Tax=Dechloromonas hankyongensis TaxID=2908002 RepID=A0ABS9K4R5_9RHOO|nr:hypothetical protein [Dechloromonas hankyongensis]MCG2578138.1 hypothetical protein [Dechloromonas hankyongensis]
MTEEIIRKPRHIGHKIAMVCAVLCGLMMIPAIGVFGWFLFTRGLADTWTPSMAAVVAFFGCCAGVLHAVSIPQPVLPPMEDTSVEPK